MPAQVIEICPARNEAEIDVIKHLSRSLSDEFTLVSNFYIPYGDRSHEIDLFVVSPDLQVLIDVKGTTGLLEINSKMWYPDKGRPSFQSPLEKLKEHMWQLKPLLQRFLKGSSINTGNLWIEYLVILPKMEKKPAPYKNAADDPNFSELLDRCILLPEAPAVLMSNRFRRKKIGSLTSDQLRCISGYFERQILPSRTEYNDWVIDERLQPVSDDAIEHYSAYQEGNKRAQFLLTRFPLPSHGDKLSADIQTLQNQYQTLLGLRSYPHPNILPPEHAFFDEDDNALILIRPMVPEQRLLSDCIEEYHQDRQLCLSTISQLLQGLAHLHKHQIVLRNLTPDSIIIDKENVPRIVGFEGVGTIFNRTITIRQHIPDPDSKNESPKKKTYLRQFFDSNYMVPEQYMGKAHPTMDVFPAGLIFYQMLVGKRPFENRELMLDSRCSLPPLDDGKLHQWLQTLTAYESKNRFSDAQEALIEFEKIFPELRK